MADSQHSKRSSGALRLLSLLLGLRTVAALKRKAEAATKLAEIEATACYIKTVNAVRLLVVAVVASVLLVLLAVFGLALLHVSLFLALPWSLEHKILLIAGCGVVYTVVGVGFLLRTTSQKLWMRYSKAADLVRRATGSRKTDAPS